LTLIHHVHRLARFVRCLTPLFASEAPTLSVGSCVLLLFCLIDSVDLLEIRSPLLLSEFTSTLISANEFLKILVGHKDHIRVRVLTEPPLRVKDPGVQVLNESQNVRRAQYLVVIGLNLAHIFLQDFAGLLDAN